jgi:redox-sensing transcriptional repressor
MKTEDNKISEFTIYRLSIYKRCLEQLEREQIKTISSKDFATRFGLNSAQVRKDLAYFGEFGIRGMGYPVKTLKEQILAILGLAESTTGHKIWKAILIGAGNIGTALLNYKDFQIYGFKIIAAFETNPEGSTYSIQQKQAVPGEGLVSLYHLDQLETVITEQGPDIAILAISEDDAQEIANRLVHAGIRAILNFVPVQLLVPSHVKVRTVDLVAELQSLTYHLHREAMKENEKKNKKTKQIA